MKQSLSLVMILVLLAGATGNELLFSFRKEAIRNRNENRIREGLKKEEKCLVVIPAGHEQEVQWTRPGIEFMYRGEMYDVVGMRVETERTIYTCLHDTRERDLIAHYHKATRKKKETDKHNRKRHTINYFFEETPRNPGLPFTSMHFPLIRPG